MRADHPREDDGFTVVEVVVAVVLVAAVMASAGIFFLSGVATTAGLQRRDTAVQLADEAMDLVRAVPATVTTGAAGLVEGRTRTDVEAHWAAAPAALTDLTDPAWDDTPAGDPVIPLTAARSAGGLDYTVDTYIGTCRIPSGDTSCTLSATGVTQYRVVVRVTWEEGGDRCDAGGCAFTLATLVNGDAEPVFNPDAEVAAPVAVDDAMTVFQDSSGVVDVLANDSGTFGDDSPVVVLTQPQHGTLSGDVASGRITYTSTVPSVSTDSFTYRLTGLLGDVSNTATVTIQITPGQVVDDAATTTYPAPAAVDVRANDTGPFGNGTITLGKPVGAGTASVSGGVVTVTPTVSFPGPVGPIGGNLVVNGGFEDAPGAAAGTRTLLSTLPAWTRSGGGGARFEIVNGSAPEGSNAAEVDTTANITMSQSVPTTPGTRYRISFRYSPDSRVTQSSNRLRVRWGAATVADLSHDATGLGTWWRQYTYDVTASATTTALSFTGSGTSDGIGVSLDDVRVHQLTPQPGALSTQGWRVDVPYTSSRGPHTGGATLRVDVAAPVAVGTAPRTVCLVATKNARVTLSLAAGVTAGVTTGAVWSLTSLPDANRFSTPVGPLAGNASGDVTVEARGTPATGDYPFGWSVRDAWGRTASDTVTLRVRTTC
ncbi:MAG: Ig-like domain-containing protein [Kineosporiaceae bacterium]